jgi:hypothetical protein
MWPYRNLSSFVLGFHGCDEAVGEQILETQNGRLSPSQNPYDWLGAGVYFWEESPERAFKFAQQAINDDRITQGKITRPFVLGAVIDLGFCCNLFDAQSLDDLAEAYQVLVATRKTAGTSMPENKGTDRGARFLDQAVIETMHEVREMCRLRPYDSIRAGFWEGGDLYPAARFASRNHIQIAVRNSDCIMGYFRPFRS